MARKCSICFHKKRNEIDALLISGAPYREITSRYPVSRSALERHKAHIVDQIEQAQSQQAVEGGASLLERLQGLEAIARSILEEAKNDGDRATSLKALEALRRTLETVAKFSPVRLALPTVSDARGVSKAMARVVEAAAQGSITAPEAQGFANLLELHRKTLETAELEARIVALEQKGELK